MGISISLTVVPFHRYDHAMLSFGDLLSNALHDIKKHTRKKISIVQDELGYALTPALTGDAVERWRYRKSLPAIEQVEQLTTALVAYKYKGHDRAWVLQFLHSADHPYPNAFADTLFPPERAANPAPPFSVYQPPQPRGFVGRQRELAHYRAELEQAGIALISGMAGIGKTSLAATLARTQTPVFWHTLREASADSLIYRLSGFLARLGSADLWQQLEASRMANIQPPSNATCVDALLAGLIQYDCLICLDDLQVAADDPHIQRMVLRLSAEQRPKLLLTTRRIPRFLARYHQPLPLGGLSREDSADLFTTRHSKLTLAQRNDLHTYTAGHATFLTFALLLLERAVSADKLIASLAEADNIERFLLEEVDDYLSDDERAVMETLALHYGEPVPTDALLAIAHGERTRRAMRGLLDQYLIQAHDLFDKMGLTIHAIVAEFYRLQMSTAAQRALHERAANYYAAAHPLQSADHHERAGNIALATRLLTEHAHAFANRGDAIAAMTILERLPLDELDEELAIGMQLAIADCGTVSGRFGAAKAALFDVAERLNQQPNTPQTTRTKVHVCQRMGQLLEREDVPQALQWAQRGLGLTTAEMSAERAALETQIAILHMHTGNYGAAFELLEDLQHAQLPHHLQTVVRYSLSGLHFRNNQLDHAEKLAREALKMAQQHPLLKLRVLTNLGVYLYRRGKWQEAMQMLEEGRETAKRMGDVRQYLLLSLNLAGMLIYAGKERTAQQILNAVLEQAQENGQQTLVLQARVWLVRCHITIEKWAAAQTHLAAAKPLAVEQNDQAVLAMLDGYSAEIALAADELDDAWRLAMAAVDGSRQLGDKSSEAIHWRVVGDVATAASDRERAANAYQRSLALLNPLEYYYAATTLALAKLLQGEGAYAAAAEHAATAQTTFAHLGATRDVAAAQKLLDQLKLETIT